MELVGQTHRFLFERDARSARLTIRPMERYFGYASLHVALIAGVLAIGVWRLLAEDEAMSVIALVIGGILLCVGGLFHTIDGRARARSAHPWLERAVSVTMPGAAYREGSAQEVDVDGRRLPAEGARVVVTRQTIRMRYAPVHYFDVHLAFAGLSVQLSRTGSESEAQQHAERVAELFGWPPPGGIVEHAPLSVRNATGTVALVAFAESVVLITLVVLLLGVSPAVWVVGVAGFVAAHLYIQSVALRALRKAADASAANMLRIAEEAPAARRPKPSARTRAAARRTG